MTFRSQNRKHGPLPRPFAASAHAWAVGAGMWTLCACGSLAEWQPKQGELELYAGPLPLEAERPFWLGVRGTNVGPVDVLQGDTLIASFVGLDLSEGVVRSVTAVSEELPRAVAVGYDFRRLEVSAELFEGVTSPPGEDDPPEEVFQEGCPGAVDESIRRCATPTGESYVVRFQSLHDRAVSVVELVPHTLDPTQCIPVTVLLLPVGSGVREATVQGGSVLQVLEDATVQSLRVIALPETLASEASCDFVISP